MFYHRLGTSPWVGRFGCKVHTKHNGSKSCIFATLVGKGLKDNDVFLQATKNGDLFKVDKDLMDGADILSLAGTGGVYIAASSSATKEASVQLVEPFPMIDGTKKNSVQNQPASTNVQAPVQVIVCPKVG